MRPDGADVALGTTPRGKPPPLGRGQILRKLRQLRAETAEQATERAKAMPWGASLVDRRPVLSGAWWLWRAKAVRP